MGQAQIRLNQLNVIMSRLGFQKDLDSFSVTGILDRPLEHMAFNDISDNTVSFLFRIDQGVNIIDVRFNNTSERKWTSFRSFIIEIEPQIRTWIHGKAHSKNKSGAKRKINALEFLKDVKSGLDDDTLMIKYDLSAKMVLNILSRLVWDKLLTTEELANRRQLAKTVFLPQVKCRSCNEVLIQGTEKCPHCGGPVKLNAFSDFD